MPLTSRHLGAGVAGLALAMALVKKGVPFTIYEEAKEYSVVGSVSPPPYLCMQTPEVFKLSYSTVAMLPADPRGLLLVGQGWYRFRAQWHEDDGSH
jgi:2-polyprenyl-6-methoxyphenol hydroxylase-like FAD-dependent oxidoreductase